MHSYHKQNRMTQIETYQLVASLAQQLVKSHTRLATAESCTGGLIAQWLTDLAGSSAWFERGLVTYSNEAKQQLLGVPESVLATQGAVSEACVIAMAEGLLGRAPVDWTLAISGIAGPGGGSPDKPVGTVWIAWAGGGATVATGYRFDGDRMAIRQAAARQALLGLARRTGALA